MAQCNCCVDGVKGRICVFCTKSVVDMFAAAHVEKYMKLFNKIMTSLDHEHNLNNALNLYDQYKKNNSSILDIRLIELIISFAKRKQIENRIYMSVSRGQL